MMSSNNIIDISIIMHVDFTPEHAYARALTYVYVCITYAYIHISFTSHTLLQQQVMRLSMTSPTPPLPGYIWGGKGELTANDSPHIRAIDTIRVCENTARIRKLVRAGSCARIQC